MSFPDQFNSAMPPFAAVGADASVFWPQFPITSEYLEAPPQFDNQPPFKRPRNFEDNSQSNSGVYQQAIVSTVHPPSVPINKGITNIFFKTRMCAKFRVGQCRNGENCNFAHGAEDMRQPPHNWQELVNGKEDDHGSENWDDDQRIIHKMKLCKKYYNGEECPYGERCNFLHEDPRRFRDDAGPFRESSAISIGISEQLDNRPANKSMDPYRTVYWKTKICSRFEATGQCIFAENCHFAHGLAELKLHGGCIAGEMTTTTTGSISTKPIIPAPLTDEHSHVMASELVSIQDGSEKKRLLIWKGLKKINRIYADWIDDLPLES